MWGRNLQRWAAAAGIGDTGITLKMTRAMIETWMYSAGVSMNEICLRQGHDKLTSLNHCQAIAQASTPQGITEIKRRLAGWMV